LTLGGILDAALELGLDDLTMTRLAQHMGVSVTVLYGYVKNRDDLLKAAIARATLDHEFPHDNGQHWSDYMAGYASALYGMLIQNSQLISAFMQGGLGPQTQVEQAEVWMQALMRRGFAPEDAARLHRAVGQLVIGCAVARLHAKAVQASGSSHERELDRAIKARDARELPALHRHSKVLVEPSYGNWEEPLSWLLLGVAAHRREEAPPGSWLDARRQRADRPRPQRKRRAPRPA